MEEINGSREVQTIPDVPIINKTYPKISVVTISYNQDKYLEEAILSVLNQNYPNLEYFVIDGGSKDGSVEIIKKYADRLSYWCSEKDNGPASALNKGFSKATGEIFYYLNSDDVLLQDSFFKVMNFIHENPNYDCYYGHGYTTRGTLEEKYPVFSIRWNLNHYRLNAVSVFQPATFIRHTAFEKSKGFNEENRTQWDGELLVDLDLTGARFKRFNFPVAIFRLYPQSISGGVGGEMGKVKILKDKDRISRKIQEFKNFNTYPKLVINLHQLFSDTIVTLKRLIYRNIYPY